MPRIDTKSWQKHKRRLLLMTIYKNSKKSVKNMKFKPESKDELRELIKNPNIPLSNINTSLITDMSGLFYARRNRINFSGIAYWDVSHVTNMSCMFYGSTFDADISRWDTSNVVDMRCMFYLSSFNGDISRWDVSKVKDMSWMFASSRFNGDLSRWNVNVNTNTDFMFSNAVFDGDISKWPFVKEMGKCRIFKL